MDIAIVLTLLTLAIVAFSTERVPVDVVSMSCVILLVMFGVLDYREAFAPFGSDFIVMLASIFIVTSAIDASGVLEVWTARLLRSTRGGLRGILIPVTAITSVFSAFMNNTAVTALMVNPALAIARRAGLSPSKILLPVAYASIVGGTCTLIGTSTNVAVNAYLEKHGYATLGMWDFTGIGILLIVVTLVYITTIGVRLLPTREHEDVARHYGVREYLSEIVLTANSSLIGQIVHQSDLTRMGFTVLALIRDNRQFAPGPNITFEADDIALVKGEVKHLLQAKSTEGIDIFADTLHFYSGEARTLKLRELVVPGRSDLAGARISDVNFRRKYGMAIVALRREGRNIIDKISNIQLEVGDMLLVQGTDDAFGNLRSHHDLVVLGEYEPHTRDRRKGYLAISFFIGAIVLSSTGIIHVSIAFVIAGVLCMIVRAVKPEEAYGFIEWKLLVLIAGMTAFGTAMANSGTDRFLADLVVRGFGVFGVKGILAGFMLFTVLLTQLMSNAAAALVVLPVALKAAETLQANPLTFAICVMLSASVSLITPFEPSCILVYGPGKYRFRDFVKVGGPITIVLGLIIFVTVPHLWPL